MSDTQNLNNAADGGLPRTPCSASSVTPRTDAAKFRKADVWAMEASHAVTADFAKELEKENATLKEWLNESRRESMLLAMMAADTPQFLNPRQAMEAKAIRDRLLAPIPLPNVERTHRARKEGL